MHLKFPKLNSFNTVCSIPIQMNQPIQADGKNGLIHFFPDWTNQKIFLSKFVAIFLALTVSRLDLRHHRLIHALEITFNPNVLLYTNQMSDEFLR